MTDSTDNKHCREQQVGDIDPKEQGLVFGKEKMVSQKRNNRVMTVTEERKCTHSAKHMNHCYKRGKVREKVPTGLSRYIGPTGDLAWSRLGLG